MKNAEDYLIENNISQHIQSSMKCVLFRDDKEGSQLDRVIRAINQAQKDALLEAEKCVYPLDPHSKMDEVHVYEIKQNIRKLMK